MPYGLTLITPPAVEPLTTDEAKTWLRVDADDTTQDGEIRGLVQAAREYAENVTGRALVTQTWQMTLDRFPSLFWVGSWGNSYQDYQGYQGPSQGAGQGNWQWTLDGKTIRVPRPPLQSVTSIQYLDTAGVPQTLDPSQYQVAATRTPGLLSPAYGLAWPIARAQYEAVQITFVAGYGPDGAKVPEVIKRGMKLLVAHWYQNREAVMPGAQGEVPLGVQALLGAGWTGEYP